METIRGRLTVAYSLALTFTMALFAAVIYFDRHQADVSRVSERLESEANSVGAYLQIQSEIARKGNRPSIMSFAFSLENPADTIWGLADEHVKFLEGVAAPLIVADSSGTILFASRAAKNTRLPETLRERKLLRYALQEQHGTLDLPGLGQPYRYVIRAVTQSDRKIGMIVVAVQPESEAPLLFSMMLVSPLILVASAILGHWLAGRSLQPLDLMIRELEEVQDGRSLHRRIGVPSGRDELSRLAQTLNAMLGRVEQSFVALRRFTADASHELKTPLMVLRAGVERSLTHPQSPPDVVVALDETLEQVNRMAELVGNLLTLARADEGRASLIMVEQDLRPIVADVGETAELLGGEHGLGLLTVDIPREPVVVAFDPSRMRELLLNLVTNAIKYTPAGGQVTIRLVDMGSTVMLEVQDTGIGIAPGDITSIFERFWRVDEVRSREGDRPGTGLGLAISKWIAEAHGGTIQVSSRPGRGSTFSVLLVRAATGVIPPAVNR